MKYISFLRGINVGGHNIIKMPDLKALYEKIGFKNVSTYIQSGNVIFESTSNKGLCESISKNIQETFDCTVPVVIRTQSELQDIISRNPFAQMEPKNVHVLMLSGTLTAEQQSMLNTFSFEPDVFILSGKEIFIYYPNGAARTKLTAAFFEKKTGLIGTARNMNTIEKIYQSFLQ